MSIHHIISAFTIQSSVDRALLFPSPVQVILTSLLKISLDCLELSLTASLCFLAFSYNLSCVTPAETLISDEHITQWVWFSDFLMV